MTEHLSGSLREPDDFALVDAFVKGDEQAFDVLYKRYRKRIYALAHRYTQNSAEAEDLLQDVFIRVYENLDRFNKTSAFYTWVYRIAVNVCLNFTGRGYKKRESLTEDEFVFDQAKSSPAETGSLGIDLQEALKHLPPRQRMTFMLKVYDDLKFTDLAKVMKCSVGGAKANYFHAVRKLQERLSDYRGV